MTSRKTKALEILMVVDFKESLKKTKAIGFSDRYWEIRGSLLKGNHITSGEESEVVSVFVAKNKIRILEYKKTVETVLGRKICKIIEAKNLPLAK